MNCWISSATRYIQTGNNERRNVNEKAWMHKIFKCCWMLLIYDRYAYKIPWIVLAQHPIGAVIASDCYWICLKAFFRTTYHRIWLAVCSIWSLIKMSHHNLNSPGSFYESFFTVNFSSLQIYKQISHIFPIVFRLTIIFAVVRLVVWNLRGKFNMAGILRLIQCHTHSTQIFIREINSYARPL